MGCPAATAVGQDLLAGGLRAELDVNDPSRASAPGAKRHPPSSGPTPAAWFCWGTLAMGQALDAARAAGSGCSGTRVLRAGVGALPGAAQLGSSCIPGPAHGKSIGETSQVMNCWAEHLGGCQGPLGKPRGAPRAGERVLQGRYPVLPRKALSGT